MVAVADLLGEEDFVQECANPAPGVLLLACTGGDLEDDEPPSRVVVVREHDWVALDFEGDAFVSIDAFADGRGFVLGQNGAVIRFDWRAATPQALAASSATVPNTHVGPLGPLRRLRIVGTEVHIVGTGGRVQRLRDGAFESLPSVVLDGEKLHVKDIAGAGPDDLVVVTLEGFAARFDGKAWDFLDLPTSGGLNSICRLPDGRYAIAGYNSAVLIGAGDRWEVIEVPGEPRPYFGVAAAHDMVYLSHLGGVDGFEGGELRPLVPPAPKNEFVFLRSGPDGVWSASGKSVGRLTPAGWHPMA